MKHGKICLSSKTIDIAEHDLYLELTNRMCYYDDKNLNDVLLPYKGLEEIALECANSLVNMPVQAKYREIDGEDNLGSHEMHVLPNGEVIFNTESIGTHTEVWIEESEITTIAGDVKKLPCLYAKKRIWKRNKNFINAIKRLYESDTGLGSSWEIQTLEYSYKDGVKTLTDYIFLSDCLLGSNITPAYNGTSKAISLSVMNEHELMVAEALSIDLYNSNSKSETFEINNDQEMEGNILKNSEVTKLTSEKDGIVVNPINTEGKNCTSTEEKSVVNSKKTDDDDDIDDDIDDDVDVDDEKKKKEKCAETSALTSGDLWRKISKACREKCDDWCWVSFLFPEEHEVWCTYDGESELDFLKFTYSVENDVITVSEPEKVTLTVSIKGINTIVSDYEKTITEKDELIVKASSEITSLKSDVTELSQYKEKFNQIEQEKVEAELSQKKGDLVASVVKSGQITKEEIEASEELSGYVDNLDKKSLMALVGERLLASVNEKHENKVETSETKEIHISTNLNNEDESIVDMSSIMRNFLKK